MSGHGHQGLVEQGTEAEVLQPQSSLRVWGSLPGAYRFTHTVISYNLFRIPFLSPPSALSSCLCVAPPWAVGTLVWRVSFRKERSMFRPQADTGGPITSKPSATLPADMKQMSSWPLSLLEEDAQTQIAGSRVKRCDFLSCRSYYNKLRFGVVQQPQQYYVSILCDWHARHLNKSNYRKAAKELSTEQHVFLYCSIIFITYWKVCLEMQLYVFLFWKQHCCWSFDVWGKSLYIYIFFFYIFLCCH